jgi:hypothetical protein
MNLRILGPVPHSATWALGATPLTRKKKGKQSSGEIGKEETKKMEKMVQVLWPLEVLRRVV